MQAVQTTLGGVSFDQDKVSSWTNTVIDTVLKGLAAPDAAKPFKYVVTCVITQNDGSAVHTAAGAYWDAKKDGMCKLYYHNDTMHCVISVFGIALSPSVPVADA